MEEKQEKTDDRGGLVKVTLEFENGTMWVDGASALQWQKFVSSMEGLYISRGWPMEPIPWNYEAKPSAQKAPPAPARPPKGPKPGKKKGGKNNQGKHRSKNKSTPVT